MARFFSSPRSEATSVPAVLLGDHSAQANQPTLAMLLSDQLANVNSVLVSSLICAVMTSSLSEEEVLFPLQLVARSYRDIPLMAIFLVTSKINLIAVTLQGSVPSQFVNMYFLLGVFSESLQKICVFSMIKVIAVTILQMLIFYP